MLVVFDLDDTLFLEVDFVKSGFKAVSEHLRASGRDGFYGVAWSLFESGLRRTIFDQALARMGHPCSAALLRELVDVYRSHAGDFRMTKDSELCLRAIGGRVDLGLITDGPSVSQWNKVRSLGLLELLDHIVVTEDLGPGAAKPSPIAFKMLQGDRDSGSCVYIGDNPKKDFQAPKALGWRSIRVRRPLGLHSDQPDDPSAVPDRCLPDLAGVPSMVLPGNSWEAPESRNPPRRTSYMPSK